MIMRYAVATLLGALLCGQTASALSCARPDLSRAMEDAKSSDTVYYVLVGKIQTDAPKVKRPARSNNQFQNTPPTITRAWFDGYSLSPNRRSDVALTRFTIDIETSCLGPWCSSAPSSDQTQIAFVEARRGQAPILRIAPCSDKTFRVTPEDNQVKKLRACFDTPCKAEPHGGRY